MAVTVGRAGGDRKYNAVFITLTRSWWRGAVLAMLLTAGAALSYWYDGRTVRVADGTDMKIPVQALVGTNPAIGPDAPQEPMGIVTEQVAPPIVPGDEVDEPAAAAMAAAAVVTSPTIVASPVRTHPFDGLRLERERQRSRQAEILQTTAQDSSVSEARRRAAHEQLLALWHQEAREAEIEHLLSAQGYTGVVVLSELGAHVVVDGLLDAAAAARIGELVHRIAGVRREAITIVDGISSGR